MSEHGLRASVLVRPVGSSCLRRCSPRLVPPRRVCGLGTQVIEALARRGKTLNRTGRRRAAARPKQLTTFTAAEHLGGRSCFSLLRPSCSGYLTALFRPCPAMHDVVVVAP